ncbi:MAG: Uncharacterised protein [Prochlorococcus marinus str. MIT 9313]|nr:MAG: Uncharacterised protein [Prochlorococcus marinus str. MIT 9313]
MDVGEVVASYVTTEFTDCFEEGQRFDVSDSAADFCDHDICATIGCYSVDAFANLTSDVGDHLHSAAVVVAAAFLIDDCLIDRASGYAI